MKTKTQILFPLAALVLVAVVLLAIRPSSETDSVTASDDKTSAEPITVSQLAASKNTTSFLSETRRAKPLAKTQNAEPSEKRWFEIQEGPLLLPSGATSDLPGLDLDELLGLDVEERRAESRAHLKEVQGPFYNAAYEAELDKVSEIHSEMAASIRQRGYERLNTVFDAILASGNREAQLAWIDVSPQPSFTNSEQAALEALEEPTHNDPLFQTQYLRDYWAERREWAQAELETNPANAEWLESHIEWITQACRDLHIDLDSENWEAERIAYLKKWNPEKEFLTMAEAAAPVVPSIDINAEILQHELRMASQQE